MPLDLGHDLHGKACTTPWSVIATAGCPIQKHGEPILHPLLHPYHHHGMGM